MDISSMMGAQLASLKQVVSMSVLQMAQNTQAAGATVMLQDFAKAQAAAAPHPTLGSSLDIRI